LFGNVVLGSSALNTPHKKEQAQEQLAQVLPHLKIQIEEGEIVVNRQCHLGISATDLPHKNKVPTGDMAIWNGGFLVISWPGKNSC